MKITTDQNRATTGQAGNVHNRFTEQADSRREQPDLSTGTLIALPVDQTGGRQSAFARLDLGYTAGTTADKDLAADVERNIRECGKVHGAANAIRCGDVDCSLRHYSALVGLRGYGSAGSAFCLHCAACIERDATVTLHGDHTAA